MLFLFLGFALGQRNLTTYSGQKISIQNDGSWSYNKEYTENIQKEKKSFVESLTDFTPQQKKHTLSLIMAAEFKEVNFAIHSDVLDYKIARNEVELYDSKVNKDKSNQKVLKFELAEDKKKLSKLLKYYKDAADNLSLIYSLNRFAHNEKMIYIKELSQVYDIEMSDDIINEKPDVTIIDTIQPIEIKVDLSEQMDTISIIPDTSNLVIDLPVQPSDVFVEFSENTGIQNEVNKMDPKPIAKSIHVKKNPKTNTKKEQKNPFEFVHIPPRCILKHNVKNKRIRLISTYPDYLCGHVPQMAKKYFKDSNLLEVESIVSKSNGKVYLQFHITIMNRDAAKNYGMITKNSLIKLFGIKDNQLNLESESASVAMVEPETGKVIYKVQALLTKEHIKFLSNNPLDSMGIMWSTGFESYTIYNVDVIMHQLYCIKNSKK